MPSISTAYLILYNLACCLGWLVVLVSAISRVVVDKASPSEAYVPNSLLANALIVSQCAAVLEIVHAAVGLVRSPVGVTFMQVSSRIVALFALVYSTSAQNQPGALLMILSWSLVEVPRYAFYLAALITGDATKKTPYTLFWLRYSLFAILYPTGIIGELSVFLAAANKDDKFTNNFPGSQFVYGTFLPILYFFGSPFMIFNMVMNRKSAFKKRFAKPPPPPRGLCWPVTDEKSGERGSTPTNKSIVAAALGAIDSEAGAAALNCRNWRFGYGKHLRKLVELQCQSPEAALKAAKAGLQTAYDTFVFVAPDGTSKSFADAMSYPHNDKFYTGHIKGEGQKLDEKNYNLQIPYHGRTLQGQALKAKIQQWSDYGTIEPDTAKALLQCCDHPDWLKRVQSQYFVLLGAGSAMGPLLVLLALGANVIAIDLDRPGIWERLIKLTKDSPGTLTFPMNRDPKDVAESDYAQYAGCNLFTHTPMIRDWLVKLYPEDNFVIGSYAYLDGALHVQVSLAMDAICRDLSEKRARGSVTLAYLCTPTDLHLIPAEAHQAALDHYKEFNKKPYCKLMQLLSGGKYLKKNAQKPITTDSGKEYYLVDGISVAQGPNYALAKRMQHWRAIVARSQGCTVSSNIAPSTSTVSVVHNRTFAWAYEGMPYFKPFEIFAPETSNSVMSALLLYDINCSDSVANPSTKIDNPNQLFSYDSFHGGLWRCAYKVDSIGESSVFLYFGRIAQPYIFGAGAVVAAGLSYYFATK